MDIKKLSKDKADAAVAFIQGRPADGENPGFEGLKHVKDPWHGKPFILLDWQLKAIRDVYGTLKEDGTRRYTMAYLEVPKKTGKSEIGAALALKQLCADGEWFAEVYGCATEKAQASIIFDVAVEMVEQDPRLKPKIKPILSKKRLVYLPTKSFYQVCSSEAFSKHGLNVSACIFDELHAQPNRALWDVMTFGAGDAREQPIWWVLTTSGADPERSSVCWEVHQKAEDILLGYKADPTFYPVIYGLDFDQRRIWTGKQFELMEETDTWETRRLWNLVNPSVGVTVKENKFEEAYTNVKGYEAKEGLFRQLRLNEWIKFKITKWVPYSDWEKNRGQIDLESLKGRQCYGGLDLSSKLDLTAFVLIFPPENAYDKYIILPFFWIPEEGLEKRVKTDHVAYDKWLKDGYIFSTPGNAIDYRFVQKTIVDLKGKYDIVEIGFDSWNAQQTATELDDLGIEMIDVSQGYKLSPAMDDIEALLVDEKINHGDHPVLNWNFRNLNVKMNEFGKVRPIKDRGPERMDGMVAMFTAMNRVINSDYKDSIYETRGVLSL